MVRCKASRAKFPEHTGRYVRTTESRDDVADCRFAEIQLLTQQGLIKTYKFK